MNKFSIKIEKEMRNKIKGIESISILNLIEKLGKEKYVLLVLKRLAYSFNLEMLLKKVLNFAKKKNYLELLKVLEDNLKDEVGFNEENSHKFLRNFF